MKYKNPDDLGVLDLAVFVLSIYVLVVMGVETFVDLSYEVIRLLQYIDWVICIFFLIEFSIRFVEAPNKLKFMKWGWIDLMASIPMLPYLHFGRIFRLTRLVRAVRMFMRTRSMVRYISTKNQTTVGSAVLLGAFLLIFSSVSILHFETAPHSNIKTAEDAIWWGVVTISTVGYGDLYPVTSAGRLIGIILISGGVGLFGVFTAYIASIFVVDNKKPLIPEKPEDITSQLK